MAAQFWHLIGMSNENLSNDKLEQVPNDSQSPVKKPSIDEVDQLADELAAEFNNPDWRSWYCGYINHYGVQQVQLWRDKARRGNFPAKLFSTYLKQARERGYPETEATLPTVQERAAAVQQDTVYIPVGDLTQAEVDRMVSEGFDKLMQDEPPAAGKAIPWMNDD